MPSLRARLVDLALPLLGIKRFFSQPHRMEARIAKMRRAKSVRPRARLRRRFEITEDNSRGFPVVNMVPRGGVRPGAPHLFYLHGGGYVMDVAPVHWDSVARLCDMLGASATVPLYPLAPEATVTHTLPKIRALYDDLVERHGARNLTVMGDSAGGGMTLALAQELASHGSPMPASLVLFSPWLDATVSGEGQREIEPRDRMLAIAGLRACGERYAGETPLKDHRVSPLFGSLDALPPMAIFAGTHDILLVDSRRLVEKLSAAGEPEFLYREYEGMFHVWMLLPVPEGIQALDETAQFIARHHKGEVA